MAADAAELVDGAEGADRGVVFHRHVAGQRGAVDEFRVVADLVVVADVRVIHDQIVIADTRDAAAFGRAAIYGAEFAKSVFVADFERHALSGEGAILRIAADDGEGINAILAAKARGALNDRVMLQNAAFTELNIIADHGIRADLHTGAEPHPRRNDRVLMNF